MIVMKDVCFKYGNGEKGALNNVSLKISPGETVLLCGKSGCGKTTLTRLINGLIPHYYEGDLSGEITVAGLNTAKAKLYETAAVVGSVFQNPRSQFFCVDTTSELAFACENQGLPESVIKARIREAAAEMEIEHLLGRSIFNLSGGEKQKVACASVAAMHPEVFVLDEPTSNLDPEAIKQLRRTILLWKSQGKTVVIAEHRLHWLTDICDRVIYLERGMIGFDMSMNDFTALPGEKRKEFGLRCHSLEGLKSKALLRPGGDTLQLHDFRFSYDKKTPALQIDDMSLPKNSMIALIGPNGAGKSTFAKCLCGLQKKFRGSVTIDGVAHHRRAMLKKCYMVMQDVNHQLFCESVIEEVRLGMNKENEDEVGQILSQLNLTEYSDCHPVSLSGGQKQRVAIAAAILADKDILLFDEPTSGLDYDHMRETAKLLLSLNGKKTSLVITHDPELILRCCTHVLQIKNGKAHAFYSLDKVGCQRLSELFHCQITEKPAG
ncbi:MAG TPA: energy-coupling factor ABC transporter ATP-binding protein [Clostridiales bacterium]|nr:energy-coupling factor ABC transporter ATP-binding protein [Clostridiales bacterium]